MRTFARRGLSLAMIVGTGSACSGSAARTVLTVPTIMSVAPVVAADVHFMTGMIPHHAQAVKIASWAATHSAGAAVQRLCERIVVGQKDEIELMRNWLRDRNQPVPTADATHMRMTMNGMEHDMLMPGMLTDAELTQLDAARGAEFDRLFLTFMIRHHEGAVSMVDELFGSQGAAQDETVFRLASDVYADQTTEIDRMEKMLAAMAPPGPVR
ncbi:MAG: DUF305 domain-containing protein [Gemmatimonadota bacterium]